MSLKGNGLPVKPTLFSKPIFEADFELIGGKTYFLVGENGVGKSSFLRTLRVHHDQNSKFLQSTGVCETEFYSPPHKICSNSISLEKFCSAFGFEDQLEKWELGNCREKTTDQLSQGQKCRTMLAYAFSRQASVLLLDEPSNGLDASSRAIFAEEVKLRSNEGLVTVISSHDFSLITDQIANIIYLKYLGPTRSFSQHSLDFQKATLSFGSEKIENQTFPELSRFIEDRLIKQILDGAGK